MDISEDVKKASIQKGMKRSQTKALEVFKTASVKEFRRVIAYGFDPSRAVSKVDKKNFQPINVRDLSARKIQRDRRKSSEKGRLG